MFLPLSNSEIETRNGWRRKALWLWWWGDDVSPEMGMMFPHNLIVEFYAKYTKQSLPRVRLVVDMEVAGWSATLVDLQQRDNEQTD